MKRFHSLLAGFALFPLSLAPLALLHGAATAGGGTPSRIILTWSGDPATTQSVTWRTASMAPSPQAQLAKFTADPGFEAGASTIKASAVMDDLGNGLTAAHYRADFRGLEPNTRYCYRVGDGESWSEWSFFRTASAKPDAFRFIYIGDAQNSIRSLWSRAIRSALLTAPDARFVVHAGDLLAEGYDDRLWGEWSDALGFIGATIPSFPVPGNHDLHRPPGRPDSKFVFSVSPLWHSHFALPTNGPDIPEMPGQSYYVDYQGVRMVALDVNVFANEDFEAAAKQRVREKQLAWLNQVLGNNSNRWTIVVQHQTIYAVAKGREYAEMRAALAPLYEKYGVDLVLQGHDHSYARSHKVAAGKVVAPDAPGVIYAVSVSGPKMYQLDELHMKLMAQTYEKKQFFQTIEVSPDLLKYTSYSIDGAVTDAFELRKRGAASTYVDHAPRQAAATSATAAGRL
jgi:3',5'-cyclic AMP phosphodiesterase CpdA